MAWLSALHVSITPSILCASPSRSSSLFLAVLSRCSLSRSLWMLLTTMVNTVVRCCGAAPFKGKSVVFESNYEELKIDSKTCVRQKQRNPWHIFCWRCTTIYIRIYIRAPSIAHGLPLWACSSLLLSWPELCEYILLAHLLYSGVCVGLRFNAPYEYMHMPRTHFYAHTCTYYSHPNLNCILWWKDGDSIIVYTLDKEDATGKLECDHTACINGKYTYTYVLWVLVRHAFEYSRTNFAYSYSFVPWVLVRTLEYVGVLATLS